MGKLASGKREKTTEEGRKSQAPFGEGFFIVTLRRSVRQKGRRHRAGEVPIGKGTPFPFLYVVLTERHIY